MIKLFHKILILSFLLNFSSASVLFGLNTDDGLEVLSGRLDSSLDIFTIESSKGASLKKTPVEFVGFFTTFDLSSVNPGSSIWHSFKSIHELQSIYYLSVKARAPPASLF